MKKRVCILTATRAEYGLLKNVIDRFNNDGDIELRLVVTGMHLSEKYGLTYKEIEQDGYTIDRKISILADGNDANSISETMGNALIKFSKYFDEIKPDMLVVLGDRYETLAVCIAAMNHQVPIAHIHGGEITEGAIDDAIRHSISKMSYLHFTSTEEYRQRVIQLGEEPDRVFYVGAPGVENVLSLELLSKEELEKSIDVSLDRPYFLCTFHPVTLDKKEDVEKQINALLNVSMKHKEYIWIFTKANADAGGEIINKRIEMLSKKYGHIHLFSSLGMMRYLSAIKYSAAVVGNTSSGILEAPSLGVSTINIGDRQSGRIQADSIVNCDADEASIESAISTINSFECNASFKGNKNPYEKEGTSEQIYSIIRKSLLNGNINLMKKFYDIERR